MKYKKYLHSWLFGLGDVEPQLVGDEGGVTQVISPGRELDRGDGGPAARGVEQLGQPAVEFVARAHVPGDGGGGSPVAVEIDLDHLALAR